MHGKGFRDIWPLFHLFDELLTAFDRNGEGADLETLGVEPGLTVAHIELPAMPGTAQQFAHARAMIDARLRRRQPRHARRLVQRRALMRAAVQQRKELAVDMEHDNVAAVDADNLVAAGWNLASAGDDVTGHQNLYTARALVAKILFRSASVSGVLKAKRASS